MYCRIFSRSCDIILIVLTTARFCLIIKILIINGSILTLCFILYYLIQWWRNKLSFIARNKKDIANKSYINNKSCIHYHIYIYKWNNVWQPNEHIFICGWITSLVQLHLQYSYWRIIEATMVIKWVVWICFPLFPALFSSDSSYFPSLDWHMPTNITI